MTDERLWEPDEAPSAEGERALARCGVAADLIDKGRYEAAGEALGELWPGVGERPLTAGWPPAAAAELLLRCGALSGWLGDARDASGAQGRAKEMLSEAAQAFGALGMPSKVSEAQYELGACHRRLGSYSEARLILAEALKPLRDADVGLKAKILIRSAVVETCERKFYEAHEHLDRACAALSGPDDEWLLARADEQRALIFIEEKRYAEADTVIERAARSLEKGGASAYLSAALTARGVARARLGADEESVSLLRRAAEVAEEAGAYTNAGLAALTLIEEHGAGSALPQSELYSLFCRADEFLGQTRDADGMRRLRECASVVMRRLADAQLYDENFSFHAAVQELEAKLIGQALEESGGSVTGASKLLGLKHPTLISMLETRHRGLCEKRRRPEKRPRSNARKDS